LKLVLLIVTSSLASELYGDGTLHCRPRARSLPPACRRQQFFNVRMNDLCRHSYATICAFEGSQSLEISFRYFVEYEYTTQGISSRHCTASHSFTPHLFRKVGSSWPARVLMTALPPVSRTPRGMNLKGPKTSVNTSKLMLPRTSPAFRACRKIMEGS